MSEQRRTIARVAGIALGAAAAVAVARALRSSAEPWDGSGAGSARSQATGRRVRKAITIDRPPDEVYRTWRDLPNLPRFMRHLETVEVLDERRSRWIARAPLGATVEWEAEITEDRPGELLAWRSVEGSRVRNAGEVRFGPAPGGRGTIVQADFTYHPPGGPLAVAVAKLTGEEPDQQAGDDLRRLKQILETGEVLVSEATVGGRRLRQRPAQPVEPVGPAR